MVEQPGQSQDGRFPRDRSLVDLLRHALWRTAPVLLCALSLLAWAGCSPEKHYKVLSFFFDGVPDPNAKAAGRPMPGGRSGPVVAVKMMKHKPFAEEKCVNCHGTNQNQLIGAALTSETCLTCHKDQPKRQPVIHGPVAMGTCLWCHSPHESQYPALLRAAPARVCTQCHEQGLLTNKAAAHTDPNSDCLSCHFGHGANNRYLLRDEALVPATQPAKTRPAVSIRNSLAGHGFSDAGKSKLSGVGR